MLQMRELGLMLFAASSLAITVISLRALAAPVAEVMPHMALFHDKFAWGFWGHVLAGPLVLALAPLQLWTGARRRWPGLHRASGRLYAGLVLIGGLAGFALAASPLSEASLFARIGFMALALGWIGATAMGLVLARRGDLAGHRRWMQVSLALTFSAVTLRIIMTPLMIAGWTVAETYDVTAWGSWLLNLAILALWRRRGRQPSAVTI